GTRPPRWPPPTPNPWPSLQPRPGGWQPTAAALRPRGSRPGSRRRAPPPQSSPAGLEAGSCRPVLAAVGVEADGDVELLHAPHHVERERLVVADGVEGGEEVVGGAQLPAVGGGDEVALPEAGGRGGTAFLHDPDEDAVALRQPHRPP